MPTLHWWTGASFISPYVITIALGIASGIIIHHWSIAYELFTYCSSLIYFSVATVTTTTKTQKHYFYYCYLLLPSPLLSYYFATKHFAADIKFPGVVELTTQLLILESNLWLPCVESINFGWIIYPRKLLRSPILVGYHGSPSSKHTRQAIGDPSSRCRPWFMHRQAYPFNVGWTYKGKIEQEDNMHRTKSAAELYYINCCCGSN